MGKEAKIGVAVVGTLLIVFCGVLYQRISKLKTTPAAVAKSAAKAGEKSSLFGSPNKLAAVAGKSEEVKSPSTENSDSKASEIAPPRASYLPANDDTATNGRYGSRYSQSDETKTNPDNAPADESPPMAEVVAEQPAPAETSPPVAIGNPFARSAPANESAEPVASEPAEPTAIVTDESVGQDVAEEVASDDAGAPGRLDEIAVPAAAIAEAAPPVQQEIDERPTSRFISPPKEESVATPASRFGPAAPRTSIAEEPRGSQSIAGGQYRLGPNENFWTVSEKAYGTGGYFKALHAFNAEKHPVADELTVGDQVVVPLKAELERQFPDLCPKPGRRPASKSYAMQASAKLPANGSTYVVQEGDTLFDIARYELGKASRWAELYELNRDVIGDDIDFLRAGMELVVPDDEGKADSITRQPGEAVQR